MKAQKPFIIFVDDSPSARAMVEEGFKGSGYMLKTADGVHNLEKMLHSEPSLLKEVALFIFDFAMPDITGAQMASVLDRVYSELREVPFLIFSGAPKKEVEKGVAEALNRYPVFARNFKGYVEKKGNSLAELMEKISEILK